jgi:hypothetical protein
VSRARTLFVTILPAAIAGGFLFASAFGHADAGRGALGFWPEPAETSTAPVLVAQADPRPPARYGAPVPPAPPAPPAPPRRHGSSHGTSITIHDGKVEIEGIAELVQESLEKAVDALDGLGDVSPEVRSKLKGRIQSVRDKLRARLSKLRSMDIDQIGPELERMGDEIEREMAGIDKDLAKLSDKVGKDLAKKFGKDFGKNFGPGIPGNVNVHVDTDDDGDDDDDDDDKNSVVVTPDMDDADAADIAPALAALKGLNLDAGQRDQLAKLRAETEGQLARARVELEQMSNRLHDTLREPAASEADIARQIDSISAKEATIRKVRILAWVKARNMLRKEQRQQVEAAVKKHH